MNLRTLIIGLVLVFSALFSYAQITQTIRGSIVDQESQYPLIGVNITVSSVTSTPLGASTDIDGTFRIKDVPIGRQDLLVTYLGYKDVVLNNVIVSSAKEIVLNIEMEETFTELEEVTIVARRNGEVMNEMATVSAREFSVQETNRYAGSRGEPARMASNFAGVQGADDSRNDIVVRGNTPSGVLWRLEGINIPNPNHFSIPGTGGGPVTILNNKFLANSDFYTGAFPAEYANGVAGVFDLKMRNGNNERHEFSGQLGLLGTEFTAEGPLGKKGKASYLAMYRYSTLQLFQFLNINVGTDAIPQYQDAAFRLNFPLKKGGNLALFGIGGTSTIDIILSEDVEQDTSTFLYGENVKDQYFTTRMGVVGLSYSKPLNKSTFLKATVSAAHSRVDANHDFIVRHVEEGSNRYIVDSLPHIMDYYFLENKYSAYLSINKKINRKLSFKAGINADLMDLEYLDSARVYGENFSYTEPKNIVFEDWQIRWDAQQSAVLVQPYIQFKYKANEKLSMTGGLTGMYSSINDNSLSPFEPRLGLSYQIDQKQKLALGLGIHSQMISPYIMYYYDQDIVDQGEYDKEYNKDLGFFKSAHAVLSYDRYLGDYARIKAETYYQYLYEIPVEFGSTSFSLINSGAGFSRFFPDPLQNTGTARNYGVEFTLEKFFHNGYYYLLTGSVFDAKYRGSDNIWRNSSFNGQYAFNGLFAKEFNLNNRFSLNLGGKITYAGGRWRGIVDREASSKVLEVIYQNDEMNTIQFRPYFRTDVKASLRYNTKNVTHEFAIDLINIFATKNILTLTYAPDQSESGDPVVEEYQLGFFPVFYYKIDF
jgi:hypothetical protein